VRLQNGEGRLLELAQCHSMQLKKLTCQYRPKVRNFSTSFLFHESLAVSIAGWPIDACISVGGRADQTNHPLSNLFSYVFHHFDIVQEVAVNPEGR
jgi:hypothetical protein